MMPVIDQPALLALLAATALTALFALAGAMLRKGRMEDQARAYLAGVSYLLSDDPDGAIAELSKAARFDTDTYAAYFAMAELFRRKGELNRAIRLNQNILLHPGVPDEHRRRAQLELALDYRRSGLQDEAIAAFERLLQEAPAHLEALRHYRQLLEEVGRLERAIILQQRLIELEGKGEQVLANLLSEQARQKLGSDPGAALAFADRAVQVHPACANAQLARAEALVALGRLPQAAEPLARGLMLEPERIPRSLELLRAALASDDAVHRWLEERKRLDTPHAAPILLALALWNKRVGKVDLAREELKAVLELRPHDWAARRELGALLLQENRSEELRREYQELLAAAALPSLGFACASCGQPAAEHLFRCPSCGAWESIRRAEAPRSAPAPRI